MTVQRIRWYCGIPVLLAAWTVVSAQTVDEIIEKSLAALGGRAALEKVHSRVMKGTFALPDMGMYAPMEMYSQEPDKVFTWIEIAGMGAATSGVNGNVAWEINPMVGARVLQGPERANALVQARIEPLLHWKELFQSAELAGVEAVNGKNCWKLVLTPKDGIATTHYVDQESGLVVRIDGTRDGQAFTTSFSDYRPVDGIQVPHKVTMSSPQFGFEMTFELVQHNVPIPPEKFELPPEIKAQVQ